MKKGFTLIELLAVIVILAIIALIATPIVLSIINDTKESAVFRSAEYYLEAVEQSIMKKSMDIGSAYKPNKCIVQSNGDLLCDNEDILVIEVKGEKPTSGEITFKDGQINKVTVNLSGKDITQNSNGEFEYVLAPGLYDENDKLLISWQDLTSTEYKSITYYYAGLDEEVTSAILNVDENGVLKSAFTGMGIIGDDINYSAEYLVGKLVIDESVTRIDRYAFYECSGLTSVIIPDSVTSIDKYAFYDSSSLTSVTIPDSVTSIGEYAFSNCDGLTSITLSESLSSIEDNVFSGCSSLTSITIPSSVTSIGESAFSNCINLTSIIIPSSVTSIGYGAFSDCISLTSIVIPSSVTKIEACVFWYCFNLTSITIPSSVTSIGGQVFEECGNLTTINYTGTEAEWNTITKENMWDDGTPSNKVINYNYVG